MKNKSKYNIFRFLLFLFGIIPSAISLCFYRRNDRIVFSSEFNSQFNHNSKYIFLHMISSPLYSNYELRFVINCNVKRLELTKRYGDYFITNNSISDILYILSAKTWITSSLETPISGCFLSFRRSVFHLGHGAPIKCIGLGEKYYNLLKSIYYRVIRSNFSYFASTSPIFDDAWKSCLNLTDEQIIRLPQARNDVVCKKSTLTLNDTYKNILYAPTWRPFSDTILFPFDDFSLFELDDFLIQNNFRIHLRLHPNFESVISSDLVNLKNIEICRKADVEDINEVINDFDVLITDYSSIYVDFLLTEKPLMFLPYDLDEYEQRIGLSVDYMEFTPGPKPKTFLQFKSELRNLLTNDRYYKEEVENTNQVLNPIKSNHSEVAAKTIVRLLTR